MADVIYLDNTLRNSDWVKTLSWDLPTDVDEFLEALGGAKNLPHFMTLPAAEPMPQSLKSDLQVRGLLT